MSTLEPTFDDEQEIETVEYREKTWQYPDAVCRERGYLRYRIMKTKQAFKTGKLKLHFYFYKDSDKIPNCMLEGMQCTNKKGLNFYMVLA